MVIRTPYGDKDIEDVFVGDELLSYDRDNGNPIMNFLEGKRKFSPLDFEDEYLDGSLIKTREEIFKEIHGDFTFYLINGTYKLFKNQSIEANEYVTHAKLLEVGDVIYDDENNPVTITSIEETKDEYFWIIKVSGDHFYIADGLRLHNASRFWRGGGSSSNWNATGNTNWAATSGGANNASIPVSTDDVTFDGGIAGNGNSNSTISATITVLSLTITSGYTSTMTHNAVLTIAGNVTLGANYTIAGSSSMTISATSTITSNGKTWPNAITWSNSHTTTLVGNFVVSGQLTLNNGTFPVNKTTAETLSVNGLVTTGAGAITASTITKIIITGGTWNSGTNGNVAVPLELTGTITLATRVALNSGGSITNSGATVTTTGSTLYLISDCTLDTNGISWNNIEISTNSPAITLNSLLTVTGTLLISAGTQFIGTAGWTVSTLSCTNTSAITISLKESITYRITALLSAYSSRNGSSLLFTSSHATTKAILTLSNGATCQCLADFTRIDSSLGRPIRTFNGTLNDTLNISSISDLKTVGGSF